MKKMKANHLSIVGQIEETYKNIEDDTQVNCYTIQVDVKLMLVLLPHFVVINIILVLHFSFAEQI